MSATRSGARLLCEELQAAGVESVFGVPGTQSVPLYDALRRSRLRSVVASHELAASFMANGYFRASGKLAALLTIPGPGFTWALTGLAEARHDSAALLHLVGAPPSSERPFQFQALDQEAIAGPLAKGVLTLRRAADAPTRVAEALDLALSGEPGPVVLQWTSQAMTELTSSPAPRPARATPPAPSADQIAELRERLVKAQRPILLAGQGAADAASLVRRLAERLPAAVLTTGSGRGVLPEDHGLSLGFDVPRGDLGRLNALLRSADVVLALGCKLTAAGTALFQLELPPERLIHVDTSAEVLAGGYGAGRVILGDAGAVLGRLLEAIEPGQAPASSWTEGEVRRQRENLLLAPGAGSPEPVFPDVHPATAAGFFAALGRALPRDGIVVTDSGLHQFLVRRHHEVKAPRGLIAPFDFQSMGFALPAAIGAAVGARERPVVAILGDGGFAMSAMELLTALREKIPLTVIVFNDGQLNLIRLSQLARWGRPAGVALRNPDFETFAAAVGARFARVQGDGEEVLARAIGSREVWLLEVRLADSMTIRGLQARGLARDTTERLLGRGALRTLKRWLGR